MSDQHPLITLHLTWQVFPSDSASCDTFSSKPSYSYEEAKHSAHFVHVTVQKVLKASTEACRANIHLH